MKPIKIGLLGFGNVGTGLYNILALNNDKITNAANQDIEISKILVNNLNKKRDIDVPKEVFTNDINTILNDKDIDIVIELLGGIHPAYDYMKEALQKGKNVVTANKAVIATHGKELFKIAKDNNVAIRFEASVGGGIPIISSLVNPLSINQFEEVIGIVNGTTNYILTNMTEYGLPYEDVLKEAQAKGFAEADPTSDVEGEDAAYKLAILSSIAFGVDLEPTEIPTTGISQISEEDIEYASQFGYKIKLLSKAKKIGNQFEYHVNPTLVPVTHPLASVNNEFNALFVKGNAVGELMLYGKGAGSMPTGSAVMGDVLEVVKMINCDIDKSISIPSKDDSIELVGSGNGMYYIHLKIEDAPGVLGKISTILGEHGVSIDSVMQRCRGEKYVPLIYILHDTCKENLDTALEDIKKFEAVVEVKSILRVEQ